MICLSKNTKNIYTENTNKTNGHLSRHAHATSNVQRLQHKCEPHSTCHIQQFANQPKTQQEPTPTPEPVAEPVSEPQIEAKTKTKTKTKSKIAFCVVIPKIDATPKPETDIETAKISIKLVAIEQQSRDDACASLAKQSLLGHG